jgi:hypothetical protein
MKKNVASQSIGAQMITAADGTAFTSTVTVYVTGDNGTQTIGQATSPLGRAVHEGNGYHSYTPTQAETNYDHIAFTFKGTAAITATVQLYTTFPQTADAPTAVVNADALLVRNWLSVAQPSPETSRCVLNALRFLRNKWSISGATLTVTRENDSTTAWTSALTTSASAEAVTASDPA